MLRDSRKQLIEMSRNSGLKKADIPKSACRKFQPAVQQRLSHCPQTTQLGALVSFRRSRILAPEIALLLGTTGVVDVLGDLYKLVELGFG